MRIERVTAHAFGPLSDEELDLAPGMSVIVGPNEAGKSTVMDAICRGFYDRHNTGGEGMKSRQPWGSSLGPTVEVEFTVGGQRYRLRKRFLEDRLCELLQWRDGGWERIAEGRRADPAGDRRTPGIARRREHRPEDECRRP
jgi:DNA repair exonuclease SbcCD ATPase subunit